MELIYFKTTYVLSEIILISQTATVRETTQEGKGVEVGQGGLSASPPLPMRGVAGFFIVAGGYSTDKDPPPSVMMDGLGPSGGGGSDAVWVSFSLAHLSLKSYPELVKTDHCASGELIHSTRRRSHMVTKTCRTCSYNCGKA